MATINTKYSKGDKIWVAQDRTEKKRHPCPDCKDTGKWSATSPAGSLYEFDCPRCSVTYRSHHEASIDYTLFTPSVRELTIGSIEVNTAPNSYSYGVRYMCEETGVGSGSVYEEKSLFPTREEALAHAEIECAKKNAEIKWVVDAYSKTLEVKDYQLKAAFEVGKERVARDALANAQDILDRLNNADDFDEVKQILENAA